MKSPENESQSLEKISAIAGILSILLLKYSNIKIILIKSMNMSYTLFKENKIFFLLFISLLILNNCKSNNPSQDYLDYDNAFASYKNAKENIKNNDTLTAIDDFTKAAEFGFEPRQAYSEAIYYSLLLNKIDEAMNLSFELIENGFRDLSQMESSPFTKLKKHKKWQQLKAAIELNYKQYEASHNDIENIEIVTSDIDNFWTAYDLAKNESSFEKKRAIYLKEYFQKGSKGLKDFTFIKIRNGVDQFTEFVESHRPYYDGIREVSNQALKTLSNYPDYLRKVKQLIPDATFADTYFLMGCHTSFGTVSMNGSLIGLENVVDENTPVHTLPEYRKSITKGVNFLSFVLIHELIHNYQNTSNRTLLGATIVEGGADFITELVLGPPEEKLEYRVYGEKYEKEIWEEFEQTRIG